MDSENTISAGPFMSKAINIVTDYVQSHLDKSDPTVSFDVYIVWFSKTLQNWKALVSTTLPDAMYYEVTHNGDKNETYLDAYRKFENVKIGGISASNETTNLRD